MWYDCYALASPVCSPLVALRAPACVLLDVRQFKSSKMGSIRRSKTKRRTR